MQMNLFQDKIDNTSVKTQDPNKMKVLDYIDLQMVKNILLVTPVRYGVET